MKLSVISDEISMDFAYALDVMSDYGVRGAELRSLWDRNLVDLSEDEIDRARTIVREKGFEVSCIASPINKCDLEPERPGSEGSTHQARARSLADQPALLERCADLAALFDTRLIRIFSFWKHGELTRDIEDRIVRELSLAAEHAQQRGVVLVLENEHACYLGTGKDTARVLRRVNSPYLKAAWDPGNAFCAGEIPFPDGYDAIKDYVAHVHLKDAVRLDTGVCKFITIGDGQIDYPGQLAALRNAGYDGWLSLETHYAPYGGSGETGSRLCLSALNAMLSDSGKQA